MNIEFHTPFEWFMPDVYTKLGWKGLMTYPTMIHIFGVAIVTNQMGVFLPKCRLLVIQGAPPPPPTTKNGQPMWPKFDTIY